jgi:hypothetical protein
MRLTTAGVPLRFDSAIVGKVVRQLIPDDDRSDKILVRPLDEGCAGELHGFRGIITPSREQDYSATTDALALPIVHSTREIDHLHEGYIVVMQPKTGFVRTLHRPESVHNTLFMTERCSSNCLMCSQPPKDKDDAEQFTEINLELLRLMPPTVSNSEARASSPSNATGSIRSGASIKEDRRCGRSGVESPFRAIVP